jgi:RNAse (barnase) inhibitor barstar
MSDTPQQEKKIVKKYEVVLGIISILIIAYFIVGKYGCFMVNKSVTEVEWTDGSSHDNLKRPEKPKEATEIDRETESTVRELATLFANNKGKSNARTEGGMQRMGLTKDERNYYKNVRENFSFSDEIGSAQNWFTVLKAAGSTYKTMQDVFQDEQPEDEDDFYQELENRFGVPSSLSREFAKRGKKEVSDWALFVEENQ